MLSFPKLLQFETNTICNGKCTFCPHEKVNRQNASDMLLHGIINEIIPLVDSICPFLYQEPAQEPRLLGILRRVKEKKNVYTTIYSNMAVWNETKLRELVDNGHLDELVISFYGPTPILYAKYQPGFDWRRTRANIRYLIDYMTVKNYVKPKITMHYLITPDLIDALHIFQRDWASVPITLVAFDTYCGNILNMSSEALHHKYLRSNFKREPCSRLWTTMNILSTGDVTPCCIDFKPEIILGNINDTLPVDVWNGEKFNRLRDLHMEGRFNDIPLCKNCEVWKWL